MLQLAFKISIIDSLDFSQIRENPGDFPKDIE